MIVTANAWNKSKKNGKVTVKREWKKYTPEEVKHNLKIRHRRYRHKNPIKTKARSDARYALKTGKIKKQNCLVCGSKDTEMHHPDYNEPLQVIFYCKEHHPR